MPDDVSRAEPALMEIEAEVRRWHTDHPKATFTEIEQAIDAQLCDMRAGLLAAVVRTGDDPDASCPDCGNRLIRRGTHTRTLWTQGDVPVSLTRSYTTCPACGIGLPPLVGDWGCARAVPCRRGWSIASSSSAHACRALRCRRWWPTSPESWSVLRLCVA